jgi:hypothetical protein
LAGFVLHADIPANKAALLNASGLFPKKRFAEGKKKSFAETKDTSGKAWKVRLSYRKNSLQ